MKANFTILLLLPMFGLAQKQLPNVYSSKYQVYGGMEDGGISITEAYVFVAKKKLRLPELQFETQELQLQKGDTLIVNVHSFKAYKPNKEQTELTMKPDSVAAFSEIRQFKGKYYLNLNQLHQWNEKLNYCVKRKCLSTSTKASFDKTDTGYAP